MIVLRLILGAMMGKWGAEIVWRTMQELMGTAPTPADLHLADRLEATAAAGAITPTDPDQLDISSFDFEDHGYIWDRPHREEIECPPSE